MPRALGAALGALAAALGVGGAGLGCGDAGTSTSDVVAADAEVVAPDVEVVASDGDVDDAPSACPLPPIAVEASIEGLRGPDVDGVTRVSGVVMTIDDGILELATEGDAVSLGYDLGSFSLPTRVGDRVELAWRQAGRTFTATGFALSTAEGRLLAVVDVGEFSSAWQSLTDPLPVPGGFTARGEDAGCPSVTTECATRARRALRVEHVDGASVLVPPGGDALLTVDASRRFRVVNALLEHQTAFTCTDQMPRFVWFLLAE